jgi:hypothetical protein
MCGTLDVRALGIDRPNSTTLLYADTSRISTAPATSRSARYRASETVPERARRQSIVSMIVAVIVLASEIGTRAELVERDLLLDAAPTTRNRDDLAVEPRHTERA